MVNYTVSTAALLAVTCFSASSINAEGRKTTSMVRTAVDEVEQQRLRKLYGVATGSHFVTDVETKCEEVITGNPKVCVKVCVEVTSIKSGDSVIEETSKVSETKCKESTINVESEAWTGDGYTEVKVKNDSWKCVETGAWSAAAKPDTSAVKNVWSAPALIDEVRPADTPAKSQKQKASGDSKGKGGLRVSNASWGGGGRNLGWAAPAQVEVKVEPAKVKISNAGWGGAAKVNDKKKKVTKETSSKKEEKTKVASSSAWSAPAKVKKVVTSTTSWSAPAKVPAPTICIESTPTPAPTTCDDRYSTWYYNVNIGKCVNDDSMGGLVGEFDKLVECCGEHFIDTFCKYEDKCCSMNNHIWYYNVVANVCTNNADMTGNVGEWESDVECCSAKFEEYPCPVKDVCFPEPETILTAEPTMTPSAAPTSCENLYSTWYFDSSNGKCVSGVAGLGGEAFGSLDACCGAKYPDDEGFEYCLQYLNVDMCCLMKYDAWYYNGIEEVCTNDPGMVGNGNEEFDSESACCVVESGAFPCPSINICIPVPPPPEILTGEPTGPEILTGEPTSPELLTFAPTPPTTPENFETPFPSPAPSFGSTPTVSKETTGPPTFSRGGRK